MTADVPALDCEQQAVAFVAAHERQLVTAGPGAGKTEVVAALIAHLVETGGVVPTDELLVISFSRAAVGAVRRRLAGAEGEARLVTVRTMDSLAAIAVDELSEDDVVWNGYDDTIRRATALVEREGWDYLEGLQHLIVDEVQDVVGVRAQFLLALLRALPEDAGFTLLGDPAQALYDFQLNGGHGEKVFEKVRDVGEVAVRNLTEEYRSRSTDSAGAARLRSSFLGAPDDGVRRRLVEDYRNGLPHIGPIDEEASLLAQWEGSTAILCRTNIQALLSADLLRRNGVPVTVQRSAQERSYAAWIALTLGRSPTSRITRAEFDDLLAGVADDAPDPAPAWQALRRATRARGVEVDLRELASALSTGRGSTELETATATKVVVSTVHRAKGLQFDNVVILSPERWRPDDDHGEVARTLFVALTRSRDRMAVATGPDTRQWTTNDRVGRWVKRGHKAWQTFGFEVRGSDTRGLGPTDQSLTAAVGRPVDWVLNRHESSLQLPIYDLYSDSTLIARTTEDFGLAMARRMPGADKRQVPWPALSGGYVESLETVSGEPHKDEAAGRHGLWVSARVTGALRLSWEGDER